MANSRSFLLVPGYSSEEQPNDSPAVRCDPPEAPRGGARWAPGPMGEAAESVSAGAKIRRRGNSLGDPTRVVPGEATDASSKRWIKQRATVGFGVLENGTVASEAGFSDECNSFTSSHFEIEIL